MAWKFASMYKMRVTGAAMVGLQQEVRTPWKFTTACELSVADAVEYLITYVATIATED
jgi:hypothetical protein